MSSETARVQQTARIIRLSFAAFGAILIYVVFKVPAQEQSPVALNLQIGIVCVALFDVVIGFFAPGFLLRSAARSAVPRPNSTPAQRWFTAQVVGMAFFTSANLFAFVLHSFGARSEVVALLFTAGIGPLLLWNPVPPLTPEGTAPPQS